MCYIGETSKQVKFRVSRRTQKEHCTTLSAFSNLQTFAKEHHHMNWNNISILNKHQNSYSWKFLQACHAQVTPQSFKRSFTLAPTCTKIIHSTLGNFAPLLGLHFWNILFIIIKKRSAVQGWERVIYTHQSKDPSPTIPTYRQKEEKGNESGRL